MGILNPVGPKEGNVTEPSRVIQTHFLLHLIETQKTKKGLLGERMTGSQGPCFVKGFTTRRESATDFTTLRSISSACIQAVGYFGH